jgi:hypothetical protein
MTTLPFAPAAGSTVSVAASSSSSRVALPTKPDKARTVRIAAPSGGTLTFIKFGDSTVTAAVTDMPILPGTTEVFTLDDATHVAAITATSQTIYATVGLGGV